MKDLLDGPISKESPVGTLALDMKRFSESFRSTKSHSSRGTFSMVFDESELFDMLKEEHRRERSPSDPIVNSWEFREWNESVMEEGDKQEVVSDIFCNVVPTVAVYLSESTDDESEDVLPEDMIPVWVRVLDVQYTSKLDLFSRAKSPAPSMPRSGLSFTGTRKKSVDKRPDALSLFPSPGSASGTQKRVMTSRDTKKLVAPKKKNKFGSFSGRKNKKVEKASISTLFSAEEIAEDASSDIVHDNFIDYVLKEDRYSCVETLVMTIPFFSNMRDVITDLKERYCSTRKTSVQLAIIKVLQTWLIESPQDFVHNDDVAEIYLEIIQEIQKSKHKSEGNLLKELLFITIKQLRSNEIENLAIKLWKFNMFSNHNLRKMKFINLSKGTFEGKYLYSWIKHNYELDQQKSKDVCNEMIRLRLIENVHKDKDDLDEFGRRHTYKYSIKYHDATDRAYTLRTPFELYRFSDIAFLKIKPKTLAEQMTFVEIFLIKRINFRDFGEWVCGKSQDREKKCTNLNAYVNYFNRITEWVATEIVTTPNINERSLVLKKFLQLAKSFEELRNYSGLFQIISGINSPSILRLKRTWALVDSKHQEFFRILKKIASPIDNWVGYRRCIAQEGQYIPYIGIFLSDLTAKREGTKEKNTWLKNCDIATCITTFVEHQSTLLCEHKPIPSLQDYILYTLHTLDDEDTYFLSQQIEPSNMDI